MTDKDRVLAFFRTSQGRRIFMREIIDGLRIVEYTGRITDARKLIDCTCGEDQARCLSSEHIRNVAKGWYQYISLNQTKAIPTASVPLKPAQLVGNDLSAWQQMGAFLKGQGSKPDSLMSQIQEGLL